MAECNRNISEESAEGRLMEARLLALDPVLEGFSGVMVELWELPGVDAGDSPGYEVLEVAAGTGGTVSRLSTCCEDVALETFTQIARG